jgi:uncharacterized membrane-anchored protein
MDVALGLLRFEEITAALRDYFMSETLTHTGALVLIVLAVGAGLAFFAFFDVFYVHISYLPIRSVYILADKSDNGMSY